MHVTDAPFVDAHMHLWDLRRLRYPWLAPPFSDEGPNGNVGAIANDYLPEDYLRDLASWNLVGAVHVQAGTDPADALAETEWLETLAQRHGIPSAIVAFADLTSPDLESHLGRQAASPLVRGIRHIANWHADADKTYTASDPLGDPAWRRGYARLADFGLSFDLQIDPGQMLEAARLAAANRDIPVIVNHTGMPLDRNSAGLARWRDGMRALAQLDHVSVKLSGLGLVDHAWTTQSISPFILETIELFGTGRCMVASDAPTDKLFAPLDRVMTAHAEILAGFNGDERRDMFGRNAARIYRLNINSI